MKRKGENYLIIMFVRLYNDVHKYIVNYENKFYDLLFYTCIILLSVGKVESVRESERDRETELKTKNTEETTSVEESKKKKKAAVPIEI